MRHRVLTRNLLIATAIVTLVGGCAIKRPERVDGKVVLGELESPEVTGVEGTILNSAKSAEKAGDYGRAAQHYAQLIDQDGENIRYLLAFAENNRKIGRNDIALSTYDTILKLQPEHIEALEGRGLALLDAGEFKLSGDAFSKVMQQEKDRWRTLNGLALLFVMKENYDDAMVYFAEALKYSKNNASVLNNVGLTMAIENRLEDAVEALKKASRLASDQRILRKKIELNLAMVYGVKGDLDAAKEVAAKHLSGPALHNNMGFYAHLAKDDVLAKSYLNMALTRNPRHYERAWHNLSRIKQQENVTTQKGYRGGKRVKVR